MTRYFMTIQEAVSLVLQAGAIGGRGEIFVLDMGEPVRILDLARNMIELSGLVLDRDIRIDIVGTRPGEKLHEELWSDDEVVAATGNSKILRVTRRQIDAVWLEEELTELERLVETGDTMELVGRVSSMMKEPRRETAARIDAAARAGADPAR
jgi:FlaA1/EpsC-like NDP-sugar epimerase